jgi:hypothetical protein
VLVEICAQCQEPTEGAHLSGCANAPDEPEPEPVETAELPARAETVEELIAVEWLAHMLYDADQALGHRDIKPDNVAFGDGAADGRFLLLDIAARDNLRFRARWLLDRGVQLPGQAGALGQEGAGALEPEPVTATPFTKSCEVETVPNWAFVA